MHLQHRTTPWLIVAVTATLALSTQAQTAPAANPAPSTLPSASTAPTAPTTMVKSLSPIASPTKPTAPELLPIDKLKVPPGFRLEVYASGIFNARELAVGDKGTVFVGTRFGNRIHAIVTHDGQREIKVVASGLKRPNGVALHHGTLYVAELSRISRLDHIEDDLDHPPSPVTIYDDLPQDEAHGWKFIAVGPDDKLYVPVGQPCNNCLPPPTHGQLRRINLDGTGAEVVARGIRNTVGFDWNPVDGKLYFTDNGRDWLSEESPEDELNRVDGPNEHFGAPYCYQGNLSDPEFGQGHPCSEFKAPVALLGPHAAALGMHFYKGSQFPVDYRNAIFIARHGSWNRSVKFGGDIVVATLNDKGEVTSVKPFLTGFLQNNQYVGRVNDLAFLPDGSMLVSDDFNGAIYRISYAAP
jgi:glucose/arabinose dehydrogenase